MVGPLQCAPGDMRVPPRCLGALSQPRRQFHYPEVSLEFVLWLRGPVYKLPGRVTARFLAGKCKNRPSGLPKAGRIVASHRQKSGRNPARRRKNRPPEPNKQFPGHLWDVCRDFVCLVWCLRCPPSDLRGPIRAGSVCYVDRGGKSGDLKAVRGSFKRTPGSFEWTPGVL